MRLKIISVSILLVLLCVLLIGFSDGTQAPYIIHFKEGTTYQEAATLIPPYAQPEQKLIFQWLHPNDMTAWSGPVYYAENQNISQIRSDHWQDYYGTVLSDIAITQGVIDKATNANPNTARYLETMREVKADLDNTVFNCWDDNSCPAIPISQIRMIILDQDTLNEIQALPIVETIDAPL